MSNVDFTIPVGFRQIFGFPRYAASEDGAIISIRNYPFGKAAALPLFWRSFRIPAFTLAGSTCMKAARASSGLRG